jgi:hypothetical protein
MIAQVMREQSIPLESLVFALKPKPTKESLHVLFKSILEPMYGKTSTVGITREEMSACLEVLDTALAYLDIQIPFPDASKKTLLDFYS